MWFSQAPWYTLPVHLCRFRVRSDGGLFPGTSERPAQSDKGEQSSRSVTSSWPRTINLVPIDYAFRPRLRGRLTLLRLALSRNPWTYGEGVSHPLCRYSCQHSRFWSLHRMPCGPASQKASRVRLPRREQDTWSCITERSATTCIAAHPELRLVAWAPLHLRRRTAYLDQWAVTLSLKDGCF